MKNQNKTHHLQHLRCMDIHSRAFQHILRWENECNKLITYII